MSQEDSNKYISGFSHELEVFLDKLAELLPTEEIRKIVDKFPQLNKKKLLIKYYERTHQFKDRLTKRDETLFTKSWFVIPELDISFFWENLPSHHQLIMSTLTKLSIYSSIVADNERKNKQTKSIEQHKPLDMNTFIADMKKDTCDPSLNGNSMSQVMDSVKKVVNSSVDPAVSGLMNGLIEGIGEDLKNTDLTKGNLMENIMNIAMKHPLQIKDEKDFPIDKLLSSAQSLMKNLGLPAIDLQGLAQRAADVAENNNSPEEVMKPVKEIAEQMGIHNLPTPNSNMTENDLVKMTQSMMKNMDINALTKMTKK